MSKKKRTYETVLSERSEILLSNGTRFVVRHNLSQYGLSIDAALHNWLPRTSKFTGESFCAYVKSKHIEGLLCDLENPEEIKQAT